MTATHPLLTNLEQARITHQAAPRFSKEQREALDVFEQAKRDLIAAGGRFYDLVDRTGSGTLCEIGAINGEIYNPHNYPIEAVTAALTVKAAEEARQAELSKPNEAVAEAFLRAAGKQTVSWRLGDIRINRNGSIFCKADRPPEKVRAEAIEQLDLVGAHRKRTRSAAARSGGATRLRRQLREINLLIETYLASGQWSPSDRCRCCRRNLTDPTSIARGIGPECYDRILKLTETARIHGGPVDSWALTVEEIVGELPTRPHPSGCSTCGEFGYDRLAGRKFCQACGAKINLETARRLRMRDDDKDAAGKVEFETWADEARCVLNDPEVLRAIIASAEADAACDRADARTHQAYRDANPAEVEQARNAAYEAWRTKREAHERMKNTEKVAHQRFRAEHHLKMGARHDAR